MENCCSPGCRWWCLSWCLCAVPFSAKCLGWDLGLNWESLYEGFPTYFLQFYRTHWLFTLIALNSELSLDYCRFSWTDSDSLFSLMHCFNRIFLQRIIASPQVVLKACRSMFLRASSHCTLYILWFFEGHWAHNDLVLKKDLRYGRQARLSLSIALSWSKRINSEKYTELYRTATFHMIW